MAGQGKIKHKLLSVCLVGPSHSPLCSEPLHYTLTRIPQRWDASSVTS